MHMKRTCRTKSKRDSSKVGETEHLMKRRVATKGCVEYISVQDSLSRDEEREKRLHENEPYLVMQDRRMSSESS